MKKIIVSVTNDLTNDQRVNRTCLTLVKLGYEVVLVGRELKNSSPITFPFRTKRFNLLFNKGFLFYAEYNIRLFNFLVFNKKDILFSNDLDTLIPNYLISKIQNKPLIFDSHELFSEVPELVNRPLVKSFWKKIEDIIIPNLKHAITVSNSIALYYKNLYNTNFEVIRNVPYKTSETIGSTSIKLKNNSIIYQGAINKGRGLELMIESMKLVDYATLYIVGEGDLSHILKEKVSKLKLNEKVFFLGKLDPNNLKNITNQATIGLSLEEDLGLNYRYALPNKIFDYIQAKIPVLASDLPEMAELIKHYKVGAVISDRSPENIAKNITNLFKNYWSYKSNLEKAAEELCWENEEYKLNKLLQQIQ